MIRLFASTLAIRSITAVINMGIMLLTAYYLGVAGRGELSFFLLGIAIINMLQDVVGGPSITYFASRIAAKRLLMIAFLWISLCTLILTPLLIHFDFATDSFICSFLFLSCLQGCISSLQAYFLGIERINEANWIELTRTSLLFIPIAIVLLSAKQLNLELAISSYLIGFSGATLLGIILLFLQWNRNDRILSHGHSLTIGDIFTYGIKVQLNNISQLINYRYVYYLIHRILGKEALGIYSVAVSIAETIWILSKSISTVYFSKIVNLRENELRIEFTNSTFKWSGFITVLAMLVLIFIPESLFLSILGKEYVGIHSLVLHLGPAIVSLSFFTILNHYFTGVNKNSINIYSAVFGNIIGLCVGYLLVSRFGLSGGAWTYGLTHLSMLLALCFYYKKDSGVSWKLFVPTTRDITYFKNLKK